MMRLGLFAILFAIGFHFPSALRAQDFRESVRVATFNAYLLSPIFKCANLNFADCLVQIIGETESWAEKVAATIEQDPSRFDIIVINEAWDAEAKEILFNRLVASGLYPNYVREIDADLVQVRGPALQAILNGMPAGAAVAIYGLPIVDINGEDSGLMFFANSDFEFLSLPEQAFQWGNDPGEELDAGTDQVAFTLFDACGSDDCLSAKGVGMVRLRHKPSDRIYNVVFTHMQADYFAKEPEEVDKVFTDERRAQFDQARKLIETTLSPLDPGEIAQERILMMGDLNVPNFHPPYSPAEHDSLFNTSGSFFTDVLYDAWARTTSPDDEGITNHLDNERYDYILSFPRPYDTGGAEGPICVQHMTVPTDFRALESDHNMVHADLNIGFDHCHPQIAYEVKLQGSVADGRPRLEQFIDWEDGRDITQIAFPGSMQWFHVKRQEGTYTIGVDNPDVRFDVYLPTDLTTPIASYYRNPKILYYREREMITFTFALPREFYIRVRGVNDDVTGNYSIIVRQHTCATKEEACLLQPGQPQSAVLTAAGSLFGTQDEAWFEFDVVGASSTGADQAITLVAEGLPDPGNFEAVLEDFSNTNGNPAPDPQELGTARVFSDQMGHASTGYVVIRQGSGTASAVHVSAFMETSLRFFEPHALTCEDETNPEFGSDDIVTQVAIDGVVATYPGGGEVEFDCDDNSMERQWSSYFGPPNFAFVSSAGVRVVESDDSSPDDPSRFRDVPPLAPGVTVFDGLKSPLRWAFEGGKYRLPYTLRMRLNEPVKN